LFDIGVYTSIYVLKTTRLLADHDTVYLHLKKTSITKNIKGIMQESISPKTDSDLLSIIDCDRPKWWKSFQKVAHQT
jgi:hypothetical protein